MTSKKSKEKWLPEHHRISDEKIVFFLRRHWFALFTKYLFMLVLALIPLPIYWIIQTIFPDMLIDNTGRGIITLISSLYYLFIWLTVFTTFIDYYLDIWIVTTHRIVNIEQKGLFNHIISENSLEQVQDVSSVVHGIFPTFLDYGNVLIQTAGAKNLFNFRQIPDPETVSRGINKLAEEFRLHHRHGGQPKAGV